MTYESVSKACTKNTLRTKTSMTENDSAELKIKGGTEDKSKIIFLISQ